MFPYIYNGTADDEMQSKSRSMHILNKSAYSSMRNDEVWFLAKRGKEHLGKRHRVTARASTFLVPKSGLIKE
jgi:hypothetical protein